MGELLGEGGERVRIRRDLLGASLLRRPLPRNLRLLQPEEQNYKDVDMLGRRLRFSWGKPTCTKYGEISILTMLMRFSWGINMYTKFGDKNSNLNHAADVMRTYTASSHRSGSCSNYRGSVEVWSAKNRKCDIIDQG